MAKRGKQTYQIRVTLLHVTAGWPSVWRELQVPSDIRMDRFHRVLQIAMGWQDVHLHEFRVGDRRFGRPDCEEDLGQGLPEDERRCRLHDLLDEANPTITYLYDYGDHWDHEITLEQILSNKNQQAVCLDGGCQCPPEDCGGMEGYEELLRMSEDRHYPERKAMRQWLGRAFDPGQLSIDFVNKQLAKS